jgi:hypothetical protein
MQSKFKLMDINEGGRGDMKFKTKYLMSGTVCMRDGTPLPLSWVGGYPYPNNVRCFEPLYPAKLFSTKYSIMCFIVLH